MLQILIKGTVNVERQNGKLLVQNTPSKSKYDSVAQSLQDMVVKMGMTLLFFEKRVVRAG